MTWTASDNVGVASVDLDYSLNDGASWGSIVQGSGNTGSYAWPVPNTTSSACKVRVSAHDAAGNTGVAINATDFVIADRTPPSALVVAPNGGESYFAGTTQTIRWNASDNIGVDSVAVDYSLEGQGGPWFAVAHGLAANPDTLNWTVPGTASDSGLVRVIAFDHALNAAAGLSNGFFHIVQPVVGVGNGARTLALALYRPVPNPGRGEVTLRFAMPVAGTARLDMIDISGRRVWGTDPQVLSAGEYRARWDGHLGDGRIAPSGAYFVRLMTGVGLRTTRFVWLN